MASFFTLGFFDFLAAASLEAGIVLPTGTPKARCKPPLFLVAPAIHFFAIIPSLFNGLLNGICNADFERRTILVLNASLYCGTAISTFVP